MEALATTAAYVGAGTLLFSGYDHARHLALYDRLVRRQGIWPAGLEGTVVRLATAAGVAPGVAVALLLLLLERPPLLRAVLIAITGLYLLYGSFGLWLL